MGKTTLARTVAGGSGATLLDMDDLCWIPGWSRRAPEEERAVVDEATRGASWVCAGIYGRGKDLVYSRADVVVVLNHLGRLTLIWRLIRRCVRRSVLGEICCGGNRETLWHTLFGYYGMLRMIIRYGAPGGLDAVGQQKRMLKLREHAPQAQLVLLNSQADADAFVEALIRRMGGRT